MTTNKEPFFQLELAIHPANKNQLEKISKRKNVQKMFFLPLYSSPKLNHITKQHQERLSKVGISQQILKYKEKEMERELENLILVVPIKHLRSSSSSSGGAPTPKPNPSTHQDLILTSENRGIHCGDPKTQASRRFFASRLHDLVFNFPKGPNATVTSRRRERRRDSARRESVTVLTTCRIAVGLVGHQRVVASGIATCSARIHGCGREGVDQMLRIDWLQPHLRFIWSEFPLHFPGRGPDLKCRLLQRFRPLRHFKHGNGERDNGHYGGYHVIRLFFFFF